MSKRSVDVNLIEEDEDLVEVASKTKMKPKMEKVPDLNTVDALEHLLRPGQPFDQDHRESNPSLHNLYVRTAVVHLRAIDVAILKLNDFGNLNLMNMMRVMQVERNNMVRSDAAICEAALILAMLKLDCTKLIIDTDGDEAL